MGICHDNSTLSEHDIIHFKQLHQKKCQRDSAPDAIFDCNQTSHARYFFQRAEFLGKAYSENDLLL